MAMLALAAVRRMVVSELACSQCSDEDCKTCQKHDTLPSEMSCRFSFCFVSLFFVDLIAVLTFCDNSAVLVAVFMAMPVVDSVLDEVCNDSDNDSYDEKDCK